MLYFYTNLETSHLTQKLCTALCIRMIGLGNTTVTRPDAAFSNMLFVSRQKHTDFTKVDNTR